MDIIFYNDRFPEWFKPCLESVKTNSPSCKIHIIEASPNDESCRLFDKVFVNASTNPEYFEKACIRRWIVINDYVKRFEIKKFIVMDWDILCLCDLEKEMSRFAEYDFTYQNKISIGFSMWNNQQALQDLVDMIHRVYVERDSDISKRIMSVYDGLQRDGHPGGVCDMTFASELINTLEYKTIDTYAILPGDVCFDNNMTVAWDGWRMENGSGVKRIRFLANKAFCYNNKYNKDVRMMVLHFAGHSREMIYDYWKRANQ